MARLIKCQASPLDGAAQLEKPKHRDEFEFT